VLLFRTKKQQHLFGLRQENGLRMRMDECNVMAAPYIHSILKINNTILQQQQ